MNAAYHREYYERTKEIRQSRKRRTAKARRDRTRILIKAYLEVNPCIDCGESDPIVLEFDHVRDHKIADISSMVKDGYSIDNIFAEIDKCDVRCANCHRRKTAKQLGWL